MRCYIKKLEKFSINMHLSEAFINNQYLAKQRWNIQKKAYKQQFDKHVEIST